MIDLTQITEKILAQFENMLCSARHSRNRIDEETIDRLIHSIKHHLTNKEKLFEIIRENYHDGKKSEYDYPCGFLGKETINQTINQTIVEPKINQSIQEAPYQDDLEDYVDDEAPLQAPTNIKTTSPNASLSSTIQVSEAQTTRQHFYSDGQQLSSLTPEEKQARYKTEYATQKQKLTKSAETINKDQKEPPSIEELKATKLNLKLTQNEVDKYKLGNSQSHQNEDSGWESLIDKQYELQQKLIEQCTEMSRNHSSFHISGVYNEKGSKRDNKKQTDVMNLKVMIVKTYNQPSEYLLFNKKMEMIQGEPSERLGVRNEDESSHQLQKVEHEQKKEARKESKNKKKGKKREQRQQKEQREQREQREQKEEKEEKEEREEIKAAEEHKDWFELSDEEEA